MKLKVIILSLISTISSHVIHFLAYHGGFQVDIRLVTEACFRVSDRLSVSVGLCSIWV
jgi:hypothetical protein